MNEFYVYREYSGLQIGNFKRKDRVRLHVWVTQFEFFCSHVWFIFIYLSIVENVANDLVFILVLMQLLLTDLETNIIIFHNILSKIKNEIYGFRVSLFNMVNNYVPRTHTRINTKEIMKTHFINISCV